MPRREPPPPPPDPRQLSFGFTAFSKPAFVTLKTRDGIAERVRFEDLDAWLEQHRAKRAGAKTS